MADYRGEFRVASGHYYWTVPRVAGMLAAAAFFFGVVFWLFGILAQPGRIISKTLDADNVISNYEWFRDAHQNLAAKHGQIGQFKKMLASETDKTESNRVRIELAAIQQSCRDLAARYNSNASKINRNLFMGKGVPSEVALGDCE